MPLKNPAGAGQDRASAGFPAPEIRRRRFLAFSNGQAGPDRELRAKKRFSPGEFPFFKQVVNEGPGASREILWQPAKVFTPCRQQPDLRRRGWHKTAVCLLRTGKPGPAQAGLHFNP